MFVKLAVGEQKKLLLSAIKKAGSERKLASLTGISNATISDYKLEKYNLPLERFNTIVKFLDLKSKPKIISLLQSNWGRKLGGKKCVESKKRKGIFIENMNMLKKISSERMRSWHKRMKRYNKEEYYSIQYSRFKKIGNYKFETKSKELVRNELEKEVADILFDLKIKYKYEPLVSVKRKCYFPDFAVDSTIIECTMWRGKENAYKLKKKILDLQDNGFRVYVIIPKTLLKYYKCLGNDVIIFREDFRAWVAQIFSR